jgi:hypothetical protein
MFINTRRYISGARAIAAALALGAVLFCIQADPLWCQDETTAPAGGDSAQVAPAPPDSIVAVYYHPTLRCRTCLMIEATAEKAITTEFPKELVKGKVRWRHVDFEQPEHAGIEKKYQLDGSTLVLSHWKNKKEVSWVRMDELWELTGDPEAISDRVMEQVELCLAGGCKHKIQDAADETKKKERDNTVREL